jgi:hypothetical protein
MTENGAASTNFTRSCPHSAIPETQAGRLGKVKSKVVDGEGSFGFGDRGVGKQ